jgi:hypothetical protein
VIRPKWRDIVVEDAPGGGQRVNRVNYEICVLQTLRERLRCKEVWVAGANRFRNPDEDLPADFAARRATCCSGTVNLSAEGCQEWDAGGSTRQPRHR